MELKEFSDSFGGYVYVMNSECSKCIGNFISFAKDLEANGYRDSVLVIISEATKPIVNHYIKKYDFYEKIKIVLSENDNNKWGVKSIEDYSGVVFHLKNNQIKDVYYYFPSKQF